MKMYKKHMTLIELLVVIAVIGTLASLGAGFVSSSAQKAQITKTTTTNEMILAALLQFEREYGGNGFSEMFNEDEASPVSVKDVYKHLDGTIVDYNKRGIKFLTELPLKSYSRSDDDNEYYVLIDMEYYSKFDEEAYPEGSEREEARNAWNSEKGNITIPAKALSDSSEEKVLNARFVVFTKSPESSLVEIFSYK